MLLGRPVCGLVKPNALILPPRSSLECAKASELVGRGRLDGSSACVGVDWLLSTLDFLAEERGVTLPAEKASLPGEPSCFILGVSFEGSGRVVGVVFETTDLVVVVDVPAMRGVSGVRAARLEVMVGRVGRAGRAVSPPRSDMSRWRYRGRGMKMVVVARRRRDLMIDRSDCYDLTTAANVGSGVALGVMPLIVPVLRLVQCGTQHPLVLQLSLCLYSPPVCAGPDVRDLPSP